MEIIRGALEIGQFIRPPMFLLWVMHGDVLSEEWRDIHEQAMDPQDPIVSKYKYDWWNEEEWKEEKMNLEKFMTAMNFHYSKVMGCSVCIPL